MRCARTAAAQKNACAQVIRQSRLLQIMQMPVFLGQTNSISGLKSALDQPEFVTGIGLVRFGSFKTRKHDSKPSFTKGIKVALGRLLQRP